MTKGNQYSDIHHYKYFLIHRLYMMKNESTFVNRPFQNRLFQIFIITKLKYINLMRNAFWLSGLILPSLLPQYIQAENHPNIISSSQTSNEEMPSDVAVMTESLLPTSILWPKTATISVMPTRPAPAALLPGPDCLPVCLPGITAC